ncbi:hypothetical protein ABZ621_34025 [Streptomyces sp. NPDC007863]|uniref:hypothetical protein n=1 Tax=Streptomyces sp. NPDC007863 TaxID=3154894 RepID=UPI00340B7708
MAEQESTGGSPAGGSEEGLSPAESTGKSLLWVFLSAAVILFGVFRLASSLSDVFGDHSDARPGPVVRFDTFEAGECGGPDPAKPGSYRQYPCDGTAATFKALEVKNLITAAIRGSGQCPPGTDLVIGLKTHWAFRATEDPALAEIPDGIVCGRNLSDDHPGDPGRGGGQVVVGDCLTATGAETPCAAKKPAPARKVLAIVGTRADCPAATVGTQPLARPLGRTFDVVCAGKP